MMYTKDLQHRHIMLPSIPSSSSSTRLSSSSLSSAALTYQDHENRADHEKAKKQKKTPLYDRVLPLLTGVVDYGILFTNMLIIKQGTRSLRETRGTWGLIVGTLLANVLATGLYVVREEVHVWLLGPERISPYKIRHKETPEKASSSTKTTKKAASSAPHPYNIPTLLKVLMSSGMVTILLMRYGIVWDEDVEFTYAGWKRIFVPFYALLLVRDVFFMAPFHTLMHYTKSSNTVLKWFRTVHYKHHEVGKSAQSLHAYHIDDVDLFIENVGAPILWSCVQYLWGMDHVGLSFNTIVLFTLHDIGLHSVNPYSIMYFNPILDYLLYPNVCHQLHHTPKYQNTYICFTPYHHILSPQLKRIDMQRYDANFKTKFFT